MGNPNLLVQMAFSRVKLVVASIRKFYDGRMICVLGSRITELADCNFLVRNIVDYMYMYSVHDTLREGRVRREHGPSRSTKCPCVPDCLATGLPEDWFAMQGTGAWAPRGRGLSPISILKTVSRRCRSSRACCALSVPERS